MSANKSDPNTDTTTTAANASAGSRPTSSGSANWWGGWLQTAKEKSSEAYEFLKRDLSELKETVQSDTALVMANVSSTAYYVKDTIADTITDIGNTIAHTVDPTDADHTNTAQTSADPNASPAPAVADPTESSESSIDSDLKSLADKARQKLATLFGTIADAFVMNRDYYESDETSEMFVVVDGELLAIERWQTLLAAIQQDSRTYCHEPDGPPETYENWLTTFNLIDYQTQMARLLETVPQMADYYRQLVPASLSDVDFWHRYYYKVHALRESERKRILESNRLRSASVSSDEIAVGGDPSQVPVKLLQPSIPANDSFSDLVVIKSGGSSSPQSSDTIHSEAGSEDWEKMADVNELSSLDESQPSAKCSTVFSEELLTGKCERVGDDWVEYK